MMHCENPQLPDLPVTLTQCHFPRRILREAESKLRQ
ncbi:MAG: hypothetical protein FD172_4101 [Methylocystaceae bacterium]|nr:MAG: hypothetical protein FD172_4101 [Methylocystaceae bacterium]